MKIPETAIVLILASILDYSIGDPRDWYHPVQAIGSFIKLTTDAVLKHTDNKILRKLAGIILGTGLISSAGLLSRLTFYLLRDFPVLNLSLQVILLASCFALRSLRHAAEDVLIPLSAGNLDLARSRLSFYVGRDTDNLSEADIQRAVMETVSENAVDGVTAPLFYALLGSFLGIGPVPLALSYKTASTLDSMIGYIKEPYRDIGWFSAKFEDILTFVPCRLTVLTLALLSRKPLYVLSICRRDAIKDPSPNSGWSECVHAAIFGVRLGGINYYGGVSKEKPLLGDEIRPITPDIIDKSLNLTRNCFLIWLTIGLLFLVLKF